ncbi:MAG: hypothetical protein WBM69_14845 [Desulfobacterales bacterium]
MEIPSELISVIERHAFRKASPAVQVLIDEIMARHGQAAQGILFYGSCLRTGDDLDGLVDLYLLVDSYRKAYSGSGLVPALLNALLPPNVFYLEREFEGQTVRTKYAVLSLADFQKGTSKRWFHSYLWGRFSQPTGILYARNEEVARLVLKGFARSVLTFAHRVLPRISTEFTARQLWGRGLELSYRAELRSERPEKRARLFDAAPQYYEEVTHLSMDTVSYPVAAIAGTDPAQYRACIPEGVRWVSRITWGLRSWQGKLLSVLRLVKAMTTFEGGVDYILWKIKRHSGVTVDIEPRLRRHPLLAMWVLSWRLYRRGGFR